LAYREAIATLSRKAYYRLTITVFAATALRRAFSAPSGALTSKQDNRTIKKVFKSRVHSRGLPFLKLIVAAGPSWSRGLVKENVTRFFSVINSR